VRTPAGPAGLEAATAHRYNGVMWFKGVVFHCPDVVVDDA
jgi:hypothetical protein